MMTFRMPSLQLVALAIFGTGIASFVPPAVAAEQVGFAHALRLLKAGKDVPRAVQSLDIAAANGDVAATYVLGALYLEGKLVPRDRPLGLAYLKVAVADESPSWPEVRDRAQRMIVRNTADMSAAEIGETDEQVARLEAEHAARRYGNLATATRYFTAETPTWFYPIVAFAAQPVQLHPGRGELRYQPGCGTGTLDDCPDGIGAATDRRCSGEIFGVDTLPSLAAADGAILSPPKYPFSARKLRDEGTVVVLAHVDGSGLVCGAVVAGSSGVPTLDDAALDAVARWRVRPAARNGVPTEALQPLRVTFRLDRE